MRHHHITRPGMCTRVSIPLVIATLGLSLLPFPLAAEERTMTPEQMEKLAEGGDFEPEAPERPANLPDLTKGDPVPAGAKSRPPTWTLGPTGIVATFVGLYQGDQLQVQKILKGSPSEGKLQWGDVLVGMNGVKFQAGGNLAMQIGNAIIEAEKEENGGRISFMVWRDKNFVVRNGKKDLAAVDIEQVFDKARDDNSLYDWKSEEERDKEVVQMAFDEFPIDPETFEVELKLRTFPAYSDTAPYNCPNLPASSPASLDSPTPPPSPRTTITTRRIRNKATRSPVLSGSKAGTIWLIAEPIPASASGREIGHDLPPSAA